METQKTPAGKLSHWFIGILFFVIAMVGFWLASHAGAEGGNMRYNLGLILGFAGFAGIFYLVKRGFDAAH